jgi:hypothetical protein
VPGDDLGVDVALPDPAGDELGVLRAEVDDEDGVEVGRRAPSRPRMSRAASTVGAGSRPAAVTPRAMVTSPSWAITPAASLPLLVPVTVNACSPRPPRSSVASRVPLFGVGEAANWARMAW